MSALVGADWSEVTDGEVDHSRRRLLVVSASVAAALILAGSSPVQRALAALTPAKRSARDIVGSFGKSRWDWTVELAVLQHIETDRSFALNLLWAAVELDLDPGSTWRRKHALRLYDLYAAASDAGGRSALAGLVASRTSDPALLARAALWADKSRSPRARLWRTATPDGRMLGIRLASA